MCVCACLCVCACGWACGCVYVCARASVCLFAFMDECACMHVSKLAFLCPFAPQDGPLFKPNQARVVQSNDTHTGGVEVFMNDCWFPVCADLWSMDFDSASVMCSQLGYDGAISFEKSLLSSDMVGVQQLWLGDLSCSGAETMILDCNRTTDWELRACNVSPASTLTCRGG